MDPRGIVNVVLWQAGSRQWKAGAMVNAGKYPDFMAVSWTGEKKKKKIANSALNWRVLTYWKLNISTPLNTKNALSFIFN